MALYEVRNVRWSQKIKHFDVEMNPIFFLRRNVLRIKTTLVESLFYFYTYCSNVK